MATSAHPGDTPAARGRRARLREWLRRRLDRRAKGVMLAVLALLGLFTTMAVLLRQASGTASDVAVTRWVQQFQHPVLTTLLSAVSAAGYAPMSDALLALTIAGCLVARWYCEALLVLASQGAVWLVTQIKTFIERPRPTPDLVAVFGRVGETSFPSGHVAGYVAFYGLIFALVYVRARAGWARRLILAGCTAMIGLVGVSRVYLGAHWVSDVAGGYAFGAAYLLVLLEIYRWAAKLPSPSSPMADRTESSL